MIIQHGTTTVDPSVIPKKSAESSLPSAPDTLELRIRRLEEAVAGLQDTRQIEERVVDRVQEKISQNSGFGIQESSNFLMKAGRHVLPAALGIGAGAADSSSSPWDQAGARPRRAWWLFEAYDDLRSMVRMYRDYRYRRHMTWTAFLTPFVFLACILVIWFFMPTSIPVLGPLLAVGERILDVLLAFFAYKILSRELIRYREMMAGVPR
jgi:hypothetical protein